MNAKKATTHKNISSKVLKTSTMVTAETLQQPFNQELAAEGFPKNLKMQMLPYFKKEKPTK